MIYDKTTIDWAFSNGVYDTDKRIWHCIVCWSVLKIRFFWRTLIGEELITTRFVGHVFCPKCKSPDAPPRSDVEAPYLTDTFRT